MAMLPMRLGIFIGSGYRLLIMDFAGSMAVSSNFAFIDA
jgi:hypothetical protein